MIHLNMDLDLSYKHPLVGGLGQPKQLFLPTPPLFKILFFRSAGDKDFQCINPTTEIVSSAPSRLDMNMT